MRVPEISLGNGLQTQNENDLCRYSQYRQWQKQIQYPTACTVSFMVVPSVRHGGLGRDSLGMSAICWFITLLGSAAITWIINRMPIKRYLLKV